MLVALRRTAQNHRAFANLSQAQIGDYAAAMGFHPQPDTTSGLRPDNTRAVAMIAPPTNQTHSFSTVDMNPL
jgi:hypothetical protein